MKYKDELIRAQEWLATNEDVVFIGQSVKYSGNAIFNTLKTVPDEMKIEVPVFEDIQMGISMGMAMNGLVPVTCFPRFDFLICACNQLINHLDKIDYMSNSKMNPKVIIRTSIGAKKPLDGGVQHTMDYTNAFKDMLTDIDVVLLNEPDEIVSSFKHAYERKDGKSTLLIEWGDHYNDK
jgi:pyruvate/2-oxoglutarate/acetoin dehydrogenase E1 component